MMQIKVPQSLFNVLVQSMSDGYVNIPKDKKVLQMNGPYGAYEVVSVDEKEYITVEIREVPVYKSNV